MPTIINKRGIVKVEITEENNENYKKQNVEKNKEETIMETYDMTDIDEWNMKYNCNRISIEALDKIEIKKRGRGDKKLEFDKEYSVDLPGPYYDPFNNHCHLWKRAEFIPNFKCAQNPNDIYIQFADYKPGTYCSICHARNIRQQFNWRKEPDSELNPSIYKLNYSNEYVEPLKKGEYKEFDVLTVKEDKYEDESEEKYKKWRKILFKVKYVIANDKIVYNLSKYKSILLWPWEMTPYQQFKYKNQNYRESAIFIDTYKKFKDNFAYIE